LLLHPQVAEAEQRPLLLIFAGRIFLEKLYNVEAARLRIEQAAELLPQDGRVLAARADLLCQLPDPSPSTSVIELYEQAIADDAGAPDGYLGMGRLREAAQAFEEADEWYGKAADLVRFAEDPVGLLGRLGAPTSGNAYLQLSRTLMGDPAPALQ